MSNSRPIMDELDVMMMCDDAICDKMEEIDAQIDAVIKGIDCSMTNVLESTILEDHEEIDYSLVDTLEPLDASIQDIVDDEVDEIITVNDILDDNEGDLIDSMAGLN